MLFSLNRVSLPAQGFRGNAQHVGSFERGIAVSALAFIAMGLALLLAHVLRAAKRKPSIVHLIAGLLALVVTASLIRFFAAEFGLERRTEFDSVVADALRIAEEDPRPLWVFLGPSYSRNAIDDEGLTQRLNAAGRDVRVLNLSLQGASLQEREIHLRDFLRHAPRVPEAVFLDVSPEFDADPVYVFVVSKFSDRAIRQFNLQNSVSAGADLLKWGCDGLKTCVKAAAFTPTHVPLNLLNVGLLYSGKPLDAVTPMRSFDPQTEAREEVTPEDRRAGLSAAAQWDGAEMWGQARRAALISELERAGVGTVGIYLPPVIDAEKRAYVSALCASLYADRPCIAPDDPVLLEALDADVWLDPGHLLVPGTEIYSDWLVARLVERVP